MRKGKTKKIFERILDIFAWLTFGVAVVTAVLSFFSSFSSEKNGKEIFGTKILIVASDSMSKSKLSQDESIYFNSGDLILIKTNADVYSFKEGDVISYISLSPESYGQTLTHKIRKVNYSKSGNLLGYTTYGINTGVDDSAVVSPNMIIGVYNGKIPKIGKLFSYLKTPAGYYLSILTPSVLLIIYFSINVGKYLGKKEAIEEFKSQGGVKNSVEQNNLLEEKNGIVSKSEKNQEIIADNDIENQEKSIGERKNETKKD